MSCGHAFSRRGFIGAGAGLALTGCLGAAAPARRPFNMFLSPEDELRIAAEQHPKILDAFGGAYADRSLFRYLNRIASALAVHADGLTQPVRATVLDDDQPHAFPALGGRIYLTRGMIALCQDEAEIAAVIGHDLGHLAAGHVTQRYNQTVAQGALAALATPGGALAEAIAAVQRRAGGAYTAEQEFESDMLGMRFSAAAGYAPTALEDLLARIVDDARLADRIAGRARGPTGYLAVHPRSPADVAAAARAAGLARADGRRERGRFLTALEGLVFGAAPENGVLRGRAFLHADLRFGFTLPPGFTAENRPRALSAVDGDGVTIVYDHAAAESDARGHLAEVWAPSPSLRPETLDLSGFDAATATVDGRVAGEEAEIRLVAIIDRRRAHRFVLARPRSVGAGAEAPFRRMLESLRQLSAAEADAIAPLRLRTVVAGLSDTAEGYARRMPFDRFGMERWELLNDRSRNDPVRPGEVIKIVA